MYNMYILYILNILYLFKWAQETQEVVNSLVVKSPSGGGLLSLSCQLSGNRGGNWHSKNDCSLWCLQRRIRRMDWGLQNQAGLVYSGRQSTVETVKSIFLWTKDCIKCLFWNSFLRVFHFSSMTSYSSPRKLAVWWKAATVPSALPCKAMSHLDCSTIGCSSENLWFQIIFLRKM